MATVINEALHPAAFVVSEEEGHYSRDQVTVALSQTILAGQVLGKRAVVANVTSSAAADSANTGNGVLTIDATAPVRSDAKDGVYRVVNMKVATDSGEFVVFGPAGLELGRVAVGATFNGEVKFAIADGSTDFAIGDAFSITVGIEYDGDMQYAIHDAAASDGTQRAVAVALYPVTTGASLTAQLAIISRQAQVRLADLTFKSGITAAQKAEALDQLRAFGIIAR